MKKTMVGVIGPPDVVQRLDHIFQHYDELLIRPLPYDSIWETPELVRTNQHQLDLILFASQVLAEFCRGRVAISVPHLSVPFSSSSLYRSLLQARSLLGEDSLSLSVDVLAQGLVTQTLADLNLPVESVYTMELNRPFTTAELVAFHRDLWQQGKTRASFTFYRAGYHELRRLGVPVFLMDHEDPVLHQAAQMVVLEAKAIRSKDAQIMIGCIRIDRTEDLQRSLGSEYAVQQFRLRLHSLMLHLVQPLGGVLFPDGGQGFSIVTTRSAVADLSHKFTEPILVHRLRHELNLAISEGWGAGSVADLARQHAESAVRFAQSRGGGCSFVILDDTQCIGPLGSQEQSSVPLTSLEPELIALATSVGISARTVERLRFLARKVLGDDLTSQEVAQELNLTERSARRILQKLQSIGLASVEGQTFPYPRGRPKRIFRLHPPLIPQT